MGGDETEGTWSKTGGLCLGVKGAEPPEAGAFVLIFDICVIFAKIETGGAWSKTGGTASPGPGLKPPLLSVCFFCFTQTFFSRKKHIKTEIRAPFLREPTNFYPTNFRIKKSEVKVSGRTSNLYKMTPKALSGVIQVCAVA